MTATTPPDPSAPSVPAMPNIPLTPQATPQTPKPPMPKGVNPLGGMAPAMSPMAPGNPNVPPPSVPLSFVLAGGIGLIGFGVVTILVANNAIYTPMSETRVVPAMHVGMLAFLTMTVLGAVHQFGPVVAMRPLRSPLIGRITMATMLLTAWLLPLAFMTRSKATMIVGATFGLVTVTLAAWNLSQALASTTGGVPIVGLRLSITYLVITVLFGVTYAFDLHWHWFQLLPHRVLAHAHLGLLGWLGLTYIGVAEKLWPMFLLSHRPSARSGAWAVGLVALGTAEFTQGLLFDVPAMTAIGALSLVGGFAAHLTSLAGAVKHRRRSLELLHAYLFVSAAFLVLACALGILAGVMDLSTVARTRLVAAEIASLAAWLSLAVIGHTHKIVPFITYTALRERGIRTTADGKPLMFGNLFNRRMGWMSLAIGTVGFLGIILGLLTTTGALVSIGGIALTLTGLITTANLVNGPLQASRLEPTPVAPRPPMPGASGETTPQGPRHIPAWTPISQTAKSPNPSGDVSALGSSND